MIQYIILVYFQHLSVGVELCHFIPFRKDFPKDLLVSTHVSVAVRSH